MPRFVLKAFLCFFPLAAFAQKSVYIPNPEVSSIQFTGLSQTTPEELLPLLELSVGGLYSTERLNRSLKILYNIDTFSKVEADVNPTGKGVIITFHVEENYYIYSIKIKGNSKILTPAIEDALLLEENTPLSVPKLRKSVFDVQVLYVSKGYLDARIDYYVSPVAPGSRFVDVLFVITEGAKVVVEEIEVEGNLFFKASKIKGAMLMKEGKPIPDINTPALQELNFEHNQSLVEQLYYSAGFLDVEVAPITWRYERFGRNEHKGIVLHLNISEGKQYTLGKVSFRGASLFDTNTLREKLEIEEGDTLNMNKVTASRFAIYQAYQDIGHINANVTALQNKQENNRVDIDYVISEGIASHIESITIRGNTKTRNNVIMRELQLHEGEIYSKARATESQTKLNQTGYFSVVNVEPQPGSVDGLINLVVNVQEQQTGMFSFGVGYSTDSGFNLNAQVSEKNLVGTGRKLTLKGELGTYGQSLDVIYTEPWLGGIPVHLQLSANVSHYVYRDIPTDDNGDGVIDDSDPAVYWQDDPDQNLSSYDSESQYDSFHFGLGIGIIGGFATYWSASIGYRFAVDEDYNANFTTPLEDNDGWEVDDDLQESLDYGLTISRTIYTSLRFNNTDYASMPSKGLKGQLAYEYTGGFMQGDVNYNRLHASSSGYWTPVYWLNFALHVETEVLLPQFDQEFYHREASELWFDGIYKMRGWLNYPQRGEGETYIGFDIRFPLYKRLVWFETFLDWGALYPSYKDKLYDRANPENWIMSFGFGGIINHPILPLRLYVARPIEYNPAAKEFVPTGNGDFWTEWVFVFSIQGLF